MSQEQLIDALSDASGESKAAVKRVLAAQEGYVKGRLQAGEDVTLPGLGKLARVHVDERKGRHPQTGEEITSAAHFKPRFKPLKALKDAVNLPQ